MSNLNSVELFERAKRVTPGGVHSPVRAFKGLDRAPIFFTRAEGPYIHSVEGRRHIDLCMSFGPLILGHRPPEVSTAVSKMLDQAWTFGACEPYSVELAEWITQRIPWVEKIRFVSSGTEAVMSALRVARAATGRGKILKFEGCYHGHVDGLLVQAGSGLAGESAQSSAGLPPRTHEDTLVAHLDNQSELDEIFAREATDLAAVIIEPLPANYGLLEQRPEFLAHLAELCRKHNVLLIFDEVISGFRVARGGMAEILGITPDLVCYGKIIGGGFPVGAYGGKAQYMDLVAPLGPVYQAGTLSANPVGMVAGLTTLKIMEREGSWAKLNERSRAFVVDLRGELARHHLKVASFGSLFWIHAGLESQVRTINEILPEQSSLFKKIFLQLLDKGIYLPPNAYEVAFLSTAHTTEILDQVLSALAQTLREA